MNQPATEPSLPDCPTGTLVSWSPTTTTLAPAWCKRWACPNCGRRKAHKLAKRIMQTTAKRFITLTVRVDASLSPAERLDLLTASWRLVWKRIKRAQRTRARGYVRIVELTKVGNPHLHLAVDCGYIPQRQLSRWWSELTGSPIVDIRVIKTRNGIARYLSKYLTKAHQVIASRRKWSSSHSFLPPTEKAPDSLPEGAQPWIWLQASLDALSSSYEAAGVLLTPPQSANGRWPPP